MSVMETLLLACALAMDATAVTVAARASGASRGRRAGWRLGWHFGLFQGIMPLIGGLAGRALLPLIAAADHWIAWTLLTVIGGRMIREGLTGEQEDRTYDPSRGWSLVMLSVATSIDALAVGLGLSMLGADIWRTAAVIAAVTAALVGIGFWLASKMARLSGRGMNLLGGAILIGIGLRILITHLRGG